MNKEMIQKLQNQFDVLSRKAPDEDVEFWFARELQEPLGYAKWERFKDAIQWAITSCEITGYDPSNHFRDVTKMVKLGSSAERAIEDFMLTRYACYLIAQNGDPRKRLRESEKSLSQNIYERGVDDAGFGRIRSKGDAALFGGTSTQAMKKKFGVTQTRPFADFLPTLTIAAKNLATEIHEALLANIRSGKRIQI